MLVAPESSTPPLVTILSQFHPPPILTTYLDNIKLYVVLPPLPPRFSRWMFITALMMMMMMINFKDLAQ